MALTPATAYTNGAPYSEKWYSIYDIRDPQIHAELIKVYGSRMGMWDFYTLAGNTFDVKGRTLTLWEELAFKKLIELADVGSGVGIATNAAGAAITFKLAAGEYDANGYTYLRVGDTVLVPKAYMASGTDKDRLYRVISIANPGSSAAVYTAQPFFTSGVADIASRITTAVPIGTKLSVEGDAWAPGSDQPTGLSRGFRSYTAKTTITKESFRLEGGVLSQQNYLPFINAYGQNAVYNKGLLDMEFMYNAKLNSKMFLGENNENTANNVEASTLTGSQAVLGSKGFLQNLTEKAQRKSYADAWAFADFDDTKPLMLSQYVNSDSVVFLVGDLLNTSMEAAGLDATKEFSGGTDLTNKLDTIGMTYRKFLKNGIKHIIKEVSNLSDPNGLGAAAYGDYYRNMGIIIPTGENKITSEDGMKLNNVAIGNLKNGIEDRTRVMNIFNGMTGINAGNVTMTTDTLRADILSEQMFLFTYMNQLVLVEKA